MEIYGVQRFLQELESHCSASAIATFLGSEQKPFVVELMRQGNQITYGSETGVKELFVAKLIGGCNPTGSLILRSFTLEIDGLTQLPIKELRGYILQCQGDNLEFEKLTPELMFACQNTDAQTGEPLPLEQSVRYC